MDDRQDRSNVAAVVPRRNFPYYFLLPTLILITGSLYWARAVLIPIALAIPLTFLLSPLVNAVQKTRLGRVPSVFLVVALTLAIFTAVGWGVFSQINEVGRELPKYKNNIIRKIRDLRALGKGGSLETLQQTVEEIKEEIEIEDGGKTGKKPLRSLVFIDLLPR